MKYITLALLLLTGVATTSFAQGLKLPALSPTAKITQAFSTSEITIDYSRPSMRGRKIFGGLVAYGEVWRTGANAATKVMFGEDVNVGGVDVKAGTYALYTVPNVNEWEVILNKGVGNWGTGGYTTDDDVARFKVKPTKFNNAAETFTITIDDITFNSCDITLKWENTKVVIPVKANNADRIAKDITKAVEEPNIPYYQAASYYNETGQNLDKALEYVNKALETRQDAFWMWNLKARIAQQLGKKDIAIEAANKAIEVSKGSAYEAEQKRNNEAIIKAMSAKK
ncbi:MAG: DUF2911 domain-containing protein [Chitinophagaceae bacterium]|nr:DUF2911 domain-containing protein [Chitinophagaceae bacterium]MCB9045700.1 DUF2911 domain-containing protein [Chitinophagales bacterium]